MAGVFKAKLQRARTLVARGFRWLVSTSLLAFSTDSAATGIIEHLPLFHYFEEEKAALFCAPLHHLGSPHAQVQRKRRRHAPPNLSGFSRGVPFKRQNYQQIDVGIGGRISIGVRTKQDNALRMKLVRDPAGESRDLPTVHHSAQSYTVARYRVFPPAEFDKIDARERLS